MSYRVLLTITAFSAITLALLSQGSSGCFNKSDNPSAPQTSAGPYAGSWVLRHVATVSGAPPCGGDTVGVVKSEGPFTVGSDGHFTIPKQGGGTSVTGTLTSDGVVNATIPNGNGCSNGSASGNCSTVDSCAGTWTSGGSQGTWTMARVSGANPYAGSWMLTHTKLSQDPGACSEGDSIGFTKTEPTVVDVTGYWTLEEDNPTKPPVAGSITSAGVVTGVIPADTQGQGDCPAGSITGACPSPDSCVGVYVHGGNHGVWKLLKVH